MPMRQKPSPNRSDMKHKPMKPEQRWAYVDQGEFRAVAPKWQTKRELEQLKCLGEDIQRVEVRLVPKGGKR